MKKIALFVFLSLLIHTVNAQWGYVIQNNRLDFRKTSKFTGDTLVINNKLYLNTVPLDNSQFRIVVWDSVNHQIEYRNASSFGYGTVYSFSAGNLSPLFTTSVATATTTPALTFTQVSQAANLGFRSPDLASGVPTFRIMKPSDIASISGDIAAKRYFAAYVGDVDNLEWKRIVRTDVSGLDANEILFGAQDGSGIISQNNNIVTDDANTRVGFGVAVPIATVHIKGATNNAGTGFPLYIETSTGNNIMTVGDQGVFQIGSENFTDGTQLKLYAPSLGSVGFDFEGIVLTAGLDGLFRIGRFEQEGDSLVIQAVGPNSTTTGGIRMAYTDGDVTFKAEVFADIIPLDNTQNRIMVWDSVSKQIEYRNISNIITGGTVTSVGFTGGLISVANPTTTPAFTVAGTSGGIPYFSSTSTWASSALLAANALMIGGGAGATPATTTTGTGVLTALGVNTGSAGAFVVNGGALGTPSSGTGTNLTGIPEGGLSLTDITTNNTSTSAHGFFPKLTANSIYYVSNAGALTALTVGASGTVLTGNGVTSAPTWATAAVGTVTSVSGTVDRITSTGGATPVLDISATFEALLGKVANPLSQFAATTSAQFAGVISDEVGTDKVVFNTSPTFVTSLLTSSSTFALFNTTATTVNAFGATTALNIGASAATILNFGGHTTASEFRFLEPSGSGTNYSAFKAVAQAASITYSLPPTVGAAGTVLTDVAGDGVLSWAAGGAGSQTPWTSNINADGFTLFGNDGASETLTLGSTSDATKGKIIFGSASAYDEVNDRFGITQTTPTSKLHLVTNAIGITQNDAYGALLINTTAAAAGAQQMSPGIVLGGQGWKTNATASSIDVRFRTDVLPVQGSSSPGGSWQLAWSINGSAYANALTATISQGSATIISAGSLTAAGSISAGAQLKGIGSASATALLYRTTNAGGDVTPGSIFGSSVAVTAGIQSFAFDGTNAFTFLAANGSLRIARAGIQLASLDNTAGSEDADLTFLTQAAGAAMTEKLRITNDGRVYGTALHNNAGAVTGTATQYVASGTYTPTLTNVTNVAASTAYACQWMRVGNVVTVSGKVDIDVTSGIASELGLSLPIASNFAAEQNAGGAGSSAAAASLTTAIKADLTNDRAAFVFTAVSLSNDSYFFEFTYVIL